MFNSILAPVDEIVKTKTKRHIITVRLRFESCCSTFGTVHSRVHSTGFGRCGDGRACRGGKRSDGRYFRATIRIAWRGGSMPRPGETGRRRLRAGMPERRPVWDVARLALGGGASRAPAFVSRRLRRRGHGRERPARPFHAARHQSRSREPLPKSFIALPFPISLFPVRPPPFLRP